MTNLDGGSASPCAVVTGASGMVGRRLVASLETAGYRVIRLRRHGTPGDDERLWDPQASSYDPALFAGADAVIHLAGENIAAERWSERRKRLIFDSRVETTGRIAAALACSSEPPRALLVASAVGYYGDRGDEMLDERSTPGEGFLAHVCQHWEAAAEAATSAGIRLLALRFGMVLDRQGGALARMLGPFNWGLGGRLGSGRQFVSWIHLEDLVRAVLWLLAADDSAGPYNLVSPNPLRNRRLTSILGESLGRPTFLPAPAFALRLALGEMADELLLASSRVFPKRLQEAGFEHRFETFEAAMEDLLRDGRDQ